MVNMTAVSERLDNLTHEPICAIYNSPIHTSDMEFTETHDGKFLWTPKLQGVIIGSFYYGYSISQVPGARLAEIYSGKWIFGMGTGLSALLSLLIPVAAYWHTAALIIIRALQGLAQ
ncbi:inorganic phosphate cotransporter, partial [Nephila pilipes]